MAMASPSNDNELLLSAPKISATTNNKNDVAATMSNVLFDGRRNAEDVEVEDDRCCDEDDDGADGL
jgi:hypothetical protein